MSGINPGITGSWTMYRCVAAEPERRKEMKHTLIVLILAAAVLSTSCVKNPEPVSGVINFMAGTVTITDNDVTVTARVGDTVQKDSLIRTEANSFAQIAIAGNLIEVYEQSSMILSGVIRGGSGTEETDVRMGKGTVFCKVKKMLGSSRGDSFRVSSGVMVAAVRGTEFLYAVDCSRGLVATYKGIVGVRSAGGGGNEAEVRIAQGNMVEVEPGAASKVTPVPEGFRYRDFEYGKNAYMPEEASGSGTERAAKGTTPKKGTAQKSGVLTSSQKYADSSAAGKLAVKKRDEGSVISSKKTATWEKCSATTTGLTGKPGGLLEKPRMNIPELK